MDFSQQKDVGSFTNYYHRSENNGPWVVQYETEVPFGKLSATASGGETPSFHARQRRGELLPLQPYTNSQVSYYGSWEFLADDNKSPRDSYRLGKVWHVGHPAVDYRVPDGALYVQMAAARAYSQGHDTLTFLAELGKARRMAAELPWKLIRLFKQSPARTLREFNRLWLEARYGWRTLIYDLEDLASVMKSLEEIRPQRVSQKSGLTVETSSTSTETLKLMVNTIQVGSAQAVVKTSITHSVRGSIVADFTPPRLQLNPVVTAWELLPFSFIIDWVISVGQALESLSLTTLASDYVASVGHYKEVTTTAEIVDFSNVGAYVVRSCTGSSYRHTVLKSREPTTVPKLPRLNIRLDASKVTDLTALYRELSRR